MRTDAKVKKKIKGYHGKVWNTDEDEEEDLEFYII